MELILYFISSPCLKIHCCRYIEPLSFTAAQYFIVGLLHFSLSVQSLPLSAPLNSAVVSTQTRHGV